MQIISPVNADTCSSYIGKPVCAVLHDGSRYYGYLSSIEDGRLMLRMEPESAETSTKKKKKANQEAKTTGYYPYPPYGYYPRGALALELALIALLFVVPFFW